MHSKLNQLFREPEPRERPLRILAMGGPKTGKSHFIHTATDIGPLFWQDTEGGAELYPADYGYGYRVLLSKDPRATIEAIEAANAMVKEGEPRPIVGLDSMSSVWFQQQEVAEALTKKWSGGRKKDRASFRAWGPAKKPLKRIYELAHASRCHLIITARAKDEYKVSTDGTPTKIGIRPDIERNLAYAMDLILEFSVAKKAGVLQPTDFQARVTGTRSPSVGGKLPPVPIGKMFTDPKFSDLLEAMVEGSLPQKIEDTKKKQVDETFETWDELRMAAAILGWATEELRLALRKQFGPWDLSRLDEYWEWIKVTPAPG